MRPRCRTGHSTTTQRVTVSESSPKRRRLRCAPPPRGAPGGMDELPDEHARCAAARLLRRPARRDRVRRRGSGGPTRRTRRCSASTRKGSPGTPIRSCCTPMTRRPPRMRSSGWPAAGSAASFEARLRNVRRLLSLVPVQCAGARRPRADLQHRPRRHRTPPRGGGACARARPRAGGRRGRLRRARHRDGVAGRMRAHRLGDRPGMGAEPRRPHIGVQPGLARALRTAWRRFAA